MLQKLKQKIESKRYSRDTFWKIFFSQKDFFWSISSLLLNSFEILKAKPKNKSRYLFLRIKHFKIPMWEKLQIEIHSSCNRDCSWCPRYYDRTGIRKDSHGNKVEEKMPTEKVYDIIDQASKLGFRGYISFHRLSESFLDKRYLEIWKYAKAKGMKLFDDTNGDVLRNNPKLCAELDETGNKLKIGLYDSYTDEEREKEIEFWKNRFKKTQLFFSAPLKENLYLRKNSQIYEWVEKDNEELNSPCFIGRNKLRIGYHGNVLYCHENDQCTFDLGNVFEKPLEEIWWSDKRAKLMNTLGKHGGKLNFSVCRDCFTSQKINIIPFISDKVKNTSNLKK